MTTAMQTQKPAGEVAAMPVSFLMPGEYEWHEMKLMGVTFKPGVPEEYWAETIKQAQGMFQGARDLGLRARFVQADVLNFGQGTFKERWAQFQEASESKSVRLSLKTIESDCWIAGSIPIENRREMLSIEFHKLVARLPKDRQAEYLDFALENESTAKEIKKKIREDFPKDRATPTTGKNKVLVDFATPEGVMHALEKCSEYFTAEIMAEMTKAKQKEFSGAILANAEGFGHGMLSEFFERLTGLSAKFLDANEELEPVRGWSATRRERWFPHLSRMRAAWRRVQDANKAAGQTEPPEAE